MVVSEIILLIMEWIGTISFAVSGALVSIRHGLDVFGVVTVGTITAVGGGIFRDVLADKTPYVLKKHVYAMASLCGSMLYYFVRLLGGGMVITATASMALVFTIRMLATRYLWQLPKIELEEYE